MIYRDGQEVHRFSGGVFGGDAREAQVLRHLLPRVEATRELFR